MVCSFIGPSLPRKAFLFLSFDLYSGVGCDADASYATYGTPHPAIGAHSNVIMQFFNLPLSFLSTITNFVLFLFLH